MAKTSTVIRTVKSDYDGNGVIDNIYETTTVSDRKGNVLSIQDRGDYSETGPDGVWDWVTLTTNEYDRKGRLIENEYKTDWANDGTWDSISTTKYEWDGKLLLSEITTSDYENDGVPEWTYGIFNDYDRKGQLVERQMTYDWNGDGVNEQVDLYAYFYEGKQLIRETVDYYADGVIDSVTDISYA